ncbi:uncharacterized protein MELLADRAFT_72467 [Melampsora larici-populina 98AG31]|uniref:DUF3295 domain-containing protein n=1 Tax=Melampsora larici-populina (strain 98AG31 / pathotype 3-4-7) TaxID=747676 RepID=F4RUA7_MELLP|nr:uncharacterized protein MELLADRAFT_72467 [Melampsora larici-populina 98AG31]EGG04031.1 hypothetical protein MELLADRAFT_72467 [Melampsora larici-populina 98AG31]
MLFHPETNSSRHHPKTINSSKNKLKEDLGRNQSAIELRRRTEGMSGSSSIMTAAMRPSSLIKSKSTVAVPILVSNHSQDPILQSGSHPSEPPNQGIHRSVMTNLKAVSHISPIRRKPPIDVEYSSDEDDEEEDQLSKEETEEDDDDEMMISTREVAAIPLSPRTTRRNMLANEMTESVRRNLLWERQLRNNLMGTGPIGGRMNDPSGSNLMMNGNVNNVNMKLKEKEKEKEKQNGLVGGGLKPKVDGNQGTGAGAGVGKGNGGVEKEVIKPFNTKGLYRPVW